MNFFIVIVFLVGTTVYATHPEAFSALAKSFEEDIKTIQSYKQEAYFSKHKKLFKEYEKKVQQAFELGFNLDRAIANSGDTSVLKQKYLSALRKLENDQSALDRIYVNALNDSIKKDNIELFGYLIQHPMRPLQKRHIKKTALSYYEKKRSHNKIMEAELLRQEKRLDTYSRQIAYEEQQAYQEHIKVLTAVQANKIRQSGIKQKRNSVLVSTKNVGNAVEFYAQNFNAFDVTLTLKLKNIKNFIPSHKLPLYVELPAHTKEAIIQLKQEDSRLKTYYESTYGWVMGVASAKHDNSYLYGIPFKKGEKVRVSQGFNGTTSHKGYSRYAVDFAVPTGTAVYAARGGKVVSTKSTGNKGGFVKGYGIYANFIVLEHSDKTFGKYYHLKKGGVLVKVGDTINKGDLIGYSGNTGYSSGPHLHFSVSKVDPKYRQRPITLPFKFQSSNGIITEPRRGDVYVR